MQSLYEYQREPDHLSDLLPYATQVGDDPCVVRHKDGTLHYGLAYRGHDLEAATMIELRNNAAWLNNTLRRYGTGYALFFTMWRQRAHDYPPTRGTNPVIRRVDEERRAYFLEKPHYRSYYTATLGWRPPTIDHQQVERLFLQSNAPQAPRHREDILAFQEEARRFTDMLGGCMAAVEPLDAAALLRDLHRHVSDGDHPIAVPDIPEHFDCLITDRDLMPGLYPYLGDDEAKLYLRTLTFRGMPNESYPGMLQALDELPLEFCYAARYLPLDKADAYSLMKTRAGWWWQMKTGVRTWFLQNATKNEVPVREDREALSRTEELEDAMDLATKGNRSYGYLTLTVVVRDASQDGAREKLRIVERTITGQGFSVHRETLNAVEAWLGSLPGHCEANVRRPLLSSVNLAHMAPMTAVWPGPDNQVPLMLADTQGRTPFRVGLYDRVVDSLAREDAHKQALGHVLMIGSSGTGKSIGLGAMALQFQARFHPARVNLFDKKYGLAPVTQAVGGHHYMLSGDAATGAVWQPLRDIHLLAERQWANTWIEGLVESQHVPLTPDLRDELWRALDSLSRMKPAERTMSGLMFLVQRDILKKALLPYTVAGAYGHCLDRVAPPLRLSDWNCFETDALFVVEPLIAPTLAVVFHELSLSFAELTPTLLGLDEAHKYLAHPIFLTQIDGWMRELRKLNVSLVFSTQDLLEFLNSPIASVILKNCPTRLFLPDNRAQEKTIAAAYEEVGLNERQREILAFAQPHRDYLYMSSQGVRLIDLALGPYTLEVLTGRTAA